MTFSAYVVFSGAGVALEVLQYHPTSLSMAQEGKSSQEKQTLVHYSFVLFFILKV